MKYIFPAAVIGVLFVLSGCTYQNDYLLFANPNQDIEYAYTIPGYSNIERNYNYEISSPKQDAAGVHVLDQERLIPQLKNIHYNRVDFLGHTIRYEGLFARFYLEDELIFFVGVEGAGCCGPLEGLEVYLNNIPPVEDYTWVEITGVLEELYEEGWGYFLRLNLISMLQPLTDSPTPSPQRITSQEAEIMMTDENVVILDVRMPDEFESGHIKNAILLPLSEILERAEDVIPNKNAILLIYCRSGNRSYQAAHLLIEMGYTFVYDFGGILSWHGEIVR